MRKFRWPIFFLAIIVIIIYAAPIITRTFATSVTNALLDNFSDDNAQTRFISYATTIAPLRRVELAKVNQLEVFDRTSRASLFWEKVNLPEVVVRATVPVEYRYYVDLDAKWSVVLNDQILTLVVPPLMAGTPSPDISKLQFEVRKGSLFRNEVKVAKELQNEITGMLEKRASEGVNLVRETARLELASIARRWLTSETKEAQIVIQFSDEKESIR